MEIRSYRSVFDLERRIYRIDRLRLNPGGVPVRSLVYLIVDRARRLAAGSLPFVGSLFGAVPWYLRDVAIPCASAAALGAVRVRTAAPSTLRRRRGLRFLLGPRHLSGLRRISPRKRWQPAPIVVLPDGSESTFRRLRYTGPGAVRIARAHTRESALQELGSRAVTRRRTRRTVTIRALPERRLRPRLSQDRAVGQSTPDRGASRSRAARLLRAPITFIHGNCVFARGLRDAWAAFAIEPSSYGWLNDEEKQARLAAIAGAVESVGADFQFLRVSVQWDAERYGKNSAAECAGTGEAQRRFENPRGGATWRPTLGISADSASADARSFFWSV